MSNSILGPKTPFILRISGERGGVPFRPEPFLAIFREKRAKNVQNLLLASIGTEFGPHSPSSIIVARYNNGGGSKPKVDR